MDTWTTQKGFPALTVTRTGASTAEVSQRRFLLGPRDESDAHEYTWWVPVSYAAAGADFESEEALAPRAWLEAGQEAAELELEGGGGEEDVFIFNVQVNNHTSKCCSTSLYSQTPAYSKFLAQ